MTKRDFINKVFDGHISRFDHVTIKTTSGAPTGNTTYGDGLCYNSADDDWYLYNSNPNGVLASSWILMYDSA
jgi:hypothetical protein